MSKQLTNEERLIHVIRVLRTIRDVDHIIFEEMDRSRLIQRICHALIETRGYFNAWIALFDEFGKFILASEAGLGESFFPLISLFNRGELTQCGHQALSKLNTVIVSDPITDCIDCPLAINYSGRGGLSIRLEYGDKVYGLLSASIPNQMIKDKEEYSLFEEISRDIAFALYNIELSEDQKRAEQALTESENRYRSLFDSAGEAIFLCSPEGRVLSANQACQTLTGYNPNELLGTNIKELFSHEEWATIDELLYVTSIKQTIDEIDEFTLIKKNQSEAFAQLRVNLISIDEDEVGLQILALDVTEERRLKHNMQYFITQITKAQEEERLRISRELHDETTQSLASLSRDIGSFISSEPGLSATASEYLERVRETADSALEGVRRFSQNLRPSILDDLGLLASVEWLAAGMHTDDGIKAKVHIIGIKYRLTMNKELTIFRIVQEILNNIRRHSDASSTEITIDFGDDAITIIISDDGQGFHMPERTSDLLTSGKLGIMGMRERTRLLDGTLIIQSEVGKGTIITLRVPK